VLAQSHGVSLPQVAVQFGLRHPAVSSIVIGARTSSEISEDIAFAFQAVPDEFWVDLLTLS
jgi:D-threo-aldose 1-dehydrogenase